MTYTEDWYSADALYHLADLARNTQGSGRVVEIGCWEGRSTVALANAVFPADVHAVDTWKGSPGEISETLARGRDVFGQFEKNIADQTNGNVAVYRQDWREYIQVDRGPIRFCHIDATHSYEEVRDNILAVLPFLEDGSIICGDDAGHPPVAKAVLETLGDDVNLAGGTLWWLRTGDPRSMSSYYREACTTPSDIVEHLHYMHGLAVGMDAQTIIELGTRSGVSTTAWLFAAEKTGGHVWSVDLDAPPALEHERWTFIQGNDLDPDVTAQLPDQADIIFIDTSHMFDQTLAELNVYGPRVRPGGKIVLHDTELARPIGWTADQPRFPVKAAITQFCMDENFTVQYFPNCFGLGIVSVD